MFSKDRNWGKAILGGILGGLVSGMIASVLFFNILDGIIYNPAYQSPKLLMVWQELEPLPLITTNPVLFLVGLLPIAAIHGLVFAYILPSLPSSIYKRGFAYGVLLWLLVSFFFEYFTPFNLLGEPIWLVSVELMAWFVVTQLEGLIISTIYGMDDSTNFD